MSRDSEPYRARHHLLNTAFASDQRLNPLFPSYKWVKEMHKYALEQATMFNKIFVVGFPKSGTTTLTKALNRSGFKSAHWLVREGYVGELMYRGFRDRSDPWFYLQDYSAITQADICLPKDGLNFWPNLDFEIIRNVEQNYPHCLFVLNHRPVEKVISSINRWGDLASRFKESEIPGLPTGIGGDDKFRDWINGHIEKCREYFQEKHNYLELDIEQSDAPYILSEKLGAPIKWWGVANKGKQHTTKIKNVADAEALVAQLEASLTAQKELLLELRKFVKQLQ